MTKLSDRLSRLRAQSRSNLKLALENKNNDSATTCARSQQHTKSRVLSAACWLASERYAFQFGSVAALAIAMQLLWAIDKACLWKRFLHKVFVVVFVCVRTLSFVWDNLYSRLCVKICCLPSPIANTQLAFAHMAQQLACVSLSLVLLLLLFGSIVNVTAIYVGNFAPSGKQMLAFCASVRSQKCLA